MLLILKNTLLRILAVAVAAHLLSCLPSSLSLVSASVTSGMCVYERVVLQVQRSDQIDLCFLVFALQSLVGVSRYVRLLLQEKMCIFSICTVPDSAKCHLCKSLHYFFKAILQVGKLKL